MSNSLLTLINNSLNNYDDTDPLWRQFVSDHKVYLIANSTYRNITNSFIQGVNYNLKAYCRSIGYSTNCAWIVALINNIPTDVMFTKGVTFLYVPPFSVIEALYTSYITVQGN